MPPRFVVIGQRARLVGVGGGEFDRHGQPLLALSSRRLVTSAILRSRYRPGP